MTAPTSLLPAPRRRDEGATIVADELTGDEIHLIVDGGSLAR